MAIENRNLAIGTRLVASYKKQRYVCTVEADPEDEAKSIFVLEDGSRHRSPSAAGSKVMGGKAVNGWRFWSLEGDEPKAEAEPEKPTTKGGKAKKPRKLIFKTPNQKGVAEGKTSWFCSACMKSFVAEGTDEPQVCPQGHRTDDPELTAPATAEVTA